VNNTILSHFTLRAERSEVEKHLNLLEFLDALPTAASNAAQVQIQHRTVLIVMFSHTTGATFDVVAYSKSLW